MGESLRVQVASCCSQAPSSRLAARSISSSVVDQPKLSRIMPAAWSGVAPIAANVADIDVVPL